MFSDVDRDTAVSMVRSLPVVDASSWPLKAYLLELVKQDYDTPKVMTLTSEEPVCALCGAAMTLLPEGDYWEATCTDCGMTVQASCHESLLCLIHGRYI